MNCYSIKELYLRWNKITQKGGALVMEGIKLKDSLCVLDFSWNHLGKSLKKEK